MTRPDVIAGVDRISHEAIENFIRLAELHLEGKAKSTDDFTTVAFLDDAVVNLRQLLAEHAVVVRALGKALDGWDNERLARIDGGAPLAQSAELRRLLK